KTDEVAGRIRAAAQLREAISVLRAPADPSKTGCDGGRVSRNQAVLRVRSARQKQNCGDHCRTWTRHSRQDIVRPTVGQRSFARACAAALLVCAAGRAGAQACSAPPARVVVGSEWESYLRALEVSGAAGRTSRPWTLRGFGEQPMPLAADDTT